MKENNYGRIINMDSIFHAPMRRYGREGELNAEAIFSASEEASYVTGILLSIDGGYTCI